MADAVLRINADPDRPRSVRGSRARLEQAGRIFGKFL
jgi:hypothetical protein